MRTFFTLAWVAATCLLSAACFAHQQKTAISTVLFNPRTENIEVMHRFYIHDAEHAVREIFGKEADILDSMTTQRQFSQYVANRFTVFTQQQAIPLTSVGFELDGKFFWVYQETEQIADLTGLQIKHDALRDIWSSQTNTVNIERLGNVTTLTFDQSVELLSVSFD